MESGETYRGEDCQPLCGFLDLAVRDRQSKPTPLRAVAAVRDCDVYPQTNTTYAVANVVATPAFDMTDFIERVDVEEIPSGEDARDEFEGLSRAVDYCLARRRAKSYRKLILHL
jgi:hypothetical protein